MLFLEPVPGGRFTGRPHMAPGPTAETISKYMVLVASEQKLLMMRPYQVYAVNRHDPEGKKAALQAIIANYNKRYGTNHDIGNFDLYHQDVQQRIKDQRFRPPVTRLTPSGTICPSIGVPDNARRPRRTRQPEHEGRSSDRPFRNQVFKPIRERFPRTGESIFPRLDFEARRGRGRLPGRR